MRIFRSPAAARSRRLRLARDGDRPRDRHACARCSRRASRSAPSSRSTPCSSGSCEAAASLTGARYAALGVIDRSRHRARALRHDRRRRRDAGDDRRPAARPRHPRRADQRGRAAAAARPRARTRARSASRPAIRRCTRFLGVPILLRGVAYGNLYLTEKDGRRATSPTRTRSSSPCSRRRPRWRSRTRGSTSRRRAWSRQLESLNEVGNALLSELDLTRLLGLVATRLRELVGARLVAIALPAGERPADRGGGRRERGRDRRARRSRSASSKAGRVLERRRSERVDSRPRRPRDPPGDDPAARRATSGLWVPLLARDEAIGVVMAHDKLGARPALRRRRPPARGAVRHPRRDRRRPLAAGRARTRSAAWSPARSSSASGSRASSTTRPARR